jgi:hypothetical protein
MKSDFELILEECLAQMRAGKSLEECLSAHPAQADRLLPILQAAARVWEIPVPRARPDAVQAGRERLLASANSQTVSPARVSSGRFARYTRQLLGTLPILTLGKNHSSLSFAFRMAAILLIVLLATGGITIKASASSLPGDRLYSVKRTWEGIRLSLTLNQKGKQQLEEQYAAERRDEVKQLIQLRRTETVEFQAPLQEIDAGHWLVDGFQIKIDPETEVAGELETGMAVDVRARLEADGTLVAIQVRVPPGTQPLSSPIVSPTPGLTPQSGEDTETQDLKTPQDQQAPFKTLQPTKAKNNGEGQDTIQPTHTPEQETGQTPQIHQTQTPELTQQPEDQHTPEPTQSQESAHSPQPTEFHAPDQSPQPTEGHLETPQPTEGH